MASIKPPQNQHLRSSDATLVRIRLLGPPSVEVAGRPIEKLSKKARALMAYLIQRDEAETARGGLAGLLWGDRSEDQARASLRQTLSEIRLAFEGNLQPIETRGELV